MTARYLKPEMIVYLLFIGLLTACAGIKPYSEAPRVSLASIEPKDMTLLEQRYGLRLRIMNPNDAALSIEGLSYALEINDREFAYGVSRQAVDIPAFSEALLDVEVVSNLLNVMQQIQEMSGESRDSLTYRLTGKISLANSLGSLPFDYSGELSYLPTAKQPAPEAAN
ncbi:MAG: LEA type 2 family protein [Gammaproteobacteria bacterium]|jgi:LEA14-like dessication related protein